MSSEIMEVTVRSIPIQLLLPESNPYCRKFKQVYQRNPEYEYEAVLSEILKLILTQEKSPVYFDLGAFAGYFSFFPAKILGPEHRVYAFESNPAHIELLEAGKKLNQCENVEIVHAALSDRVETLRIKDNSVSAVGNLDGLPIQAITLDAYCEAQGVWPTVAKMDVHGFEGKMLGGMKQCLSQSLEFLLMELHPNVYLEKFTPGITRGMILDTLEEAGFQNYYIAGHRYTWSDGMGLFFKTGRFAYQPLTRQNRGMLLFDRHNQIFVLSAKKPLEELLGESIIDPSTE